MHGEILSARERLDAECDAASLLAGDVWLEKVVVATRDDPTTGTDEVEAMGLTQILRAVAADPAEREAIRRALEAGLGRLPPSLRQAAGVDIGGAALEGLLAHRLAAPTTRRCPTSRPRPSDWASRS